MSQISEGEKVICISGHFPPMRKHGTERVATNPPKKGEVLVVNEILGEFLRFDKYDDPENFRWWKSDHFAPLGGLFDEMITEALAHKHF